MANPTIAWNTKIISVPQSFLTAMGGASYQLDVNVFRNALKDIEDDEAGMAYPDTHRHATEATLSGVVYARQFEIINGYTVSFQNTGTPYVVSCVGGNHNIADVTNFDGGMSLVIGNSAGLITVATGGGSAPTAEQNADAILAAAQITPIYSDIRKVNNITVKGSGTTGDPWNPQP